MNETEPLSDTRSSQEILESAKGFEDISLATGRAYNEMTRHEGVTIEGKEYYADFLMQAAVKSDKLASAIVNNTSPVGIRRFEALTKGLE